MVRILVERTFTADSKYVELACLSTDTKPVKSDDGQYTYITGSLALEVDTGNVYGLDETGSGTWNKVAELGGGDSGTGGRSVSGLNAVRPSLGLNAVPTLDLNEDLGRADAEEPVGGDER